MENGAAMGRAPSIVQQGASRGGARRRALSVMRAHAYPKRPVATAATDTLRRGREAQSSASFDGATRRSGQSMRVTACDVPRESVLDRRSVDTAWFKDCWRAPLRRSDASVADIFFAVFGCQPAWMKRVIIARNNAASLFGLDTATDAEIMTPVRRDTYQVGDTIGPWPIFALSAAELVAGRNNPHLDFRLSVLKANGEAKFSTICNVHNLFGKAYLAGVIPFHTWGVRKLISDAVVAGRL